MLNTVTATFSILRTEVNADNGYNCIHCNIEINICHVSFNSCKYRMCRSVLFLLYTNYVIMSDVSIVMKAFDIFFTCVYQVLLG